MMSIGILPCQGSSNTGMMTSKVTLNKVDGKEFKTVCALGLPLGIEGIIKNAKSNEGFVALNGCPIKCASKALLSVGIDDFKEITVTDLGIQKNGNMKDETGIEKLSDKLDEVVESLRKIQ